MVEVLTEAPSDTLTALMTQWRLRFPVFGISAAENFLPGVYEGYVNDLFPVPYENVLKRVLAALQLGQVSETRFCLPVAEAIEPLGALAVKVPDWSVKIDYSDYIRNHLSGVPDRWLVERVTGSLFALSLLLATDIPAPKIDPDLHAYLLAEQAVIWRAIDACALIVAVTEGITPATDGMA